MERVFCFLTCLLFSGFLFAQDINQLDTDNKRHGVWKKYFENTKILRYEGQFEHGKEVGMFKFYKNIRNKPVLTATKIFNKDNPIAQVRFLASNGKVISEGQMDGRTYIGTWKYYQKNSDELMTLEHYNTQGELSGERIVYYSNKQIAEKQNYKNGKLEGPSIIYSNKNVILKEYIYVAGELHGMAKFYNSKGELLSEGVYKRGKKDGVWKYYEGGKLVKEEDFTYIPKYIKKAP
ncbi:toxin-antitoxin system YwqK family antitoxin [Tamlana sp. 2201CG12-4]|uniref:toxin-antitoxin system YwqK family antitoxin n=1 Tax=Tamlana sp. 2201CG12-4 TaxID=3112582 RepID=UPI002DB8F656|nr:toxin-antitoxin system YwqK family antitoxin [Tamlana sp. 2201CG12-4]MEC3907712.1 toxin-antitoxin system YwqK family antitoxin [Tamlana sp. 2201CG12-4]